MQTKESPKKEELAKVAVSTGCPYCHSPYKVNYLPDSGMGVSIECDDSGIIQPYLSVEHTGNFDEDLLADIVEQIEIKFCPFCGREL